MSLISTRLSDRISVPLDSYFALSRTNTYSLLFALPLLALYEIAVALINVGERFHVRNAADLWLRGLLRASGFEATIALSALLVAAGTLVVLRERRTRPVPIHGQYFGRMLLESAALAAAFGTIIGGLTSAVLSPLAADGFGVLGVPLVVAAQAEVRLGMVQRLVLSLGAGLYEELFFRVLLIPALIALLVATRRIKRPTATVAAVIASSLFFSAAHYLGPLGDTPELGSFIFRFIGGLAFSIILVVRGFGIVAWTHALYDVFLILSGS